MIPAQSLRRARTAVALAAAGLVVSGLLIPTTASAVTPPSVAGTFGAVKPARVLDTRGTGAAVVPFGTISVQVLGRAGVPASGVSAVVLNVTATEAVAAGALTVWASGTPQPRASNLQFGRGKTVPNQVIAPVGADGKVALHNGSGGDLQLIADVSGYFLAGTPTAPGAFGSLAPSRLLDSRNGTGIHIGPVGPQGFVSLLVAGQSGVPVSGASAVVLNVTVAGPKATGVLSVWAHGAPQPVASNLNFTHGQTIANLVVAPIGADGRVSLQNRSGGALQLVADVSGYFIGGAPVTAGAFAPVAPARILDTRIGNGVSTGAVPAHGTISLQVSGRGGVPVSGVSAVEVNVTATGGSTHGVITVWPSETTEPTASSLNYAKAQIVPNLVLAPLGPDGKIQLQNNSGGTVHLVADVAGYFLGAPLAIPAPTTSRYVRNITASSTTSTLTSEGCADATANGAGSHFSLLQIGAQSITAPLSAAAPGVVLSSTQTRLTYPELVRALTGYITGYDGCAATGNLLTVAIGTSSDGDFTTYTASAKGIDWADRVVEPLQAVGATHNVTVNGAVDIEASFAATELQAEQWESAFLNASPGTRLVYNGSADGCPTTFGAVGQACAAVTNTLGQPQIWTEAQYYRLASGISPSQIVALPQIYADAQASQWANIAQTGATASQHINFLGALTQLAACGATCSVSPSQGWAALYLKLSTSALTAPVSLPVSTDLRSDT